MARDTISIALPESLKQYVLKQVSEGAYKSASDYFLKLIQADQMRKGRQQLEALVLQGIESGGSREMTDADWDHLKRRVWERHAENAGQ